MRRVICLLSVVMLLAAMTVPVFAAEPRVITIRPSLPIEGTTASVSVSCVANYITDELEATIRLYKGSTLVRTWTVEAEGYIFFSEDVTVTPGEYTLTVDLVVNGDASPTASVSNECTG